MYFIEATQRPKISPLPQFADEPPCKLVTQLQNCGRQSNLKNVNKELSSLKNDEIFSSMT